MDSELVSRLRLAVTRLSRRLRQEGDAGLSPSLHSALATVARDGPVTLGALAAAERVQPPTMTRIVAGLEDAGLVTRTAEPRDRRISRVAVTPAGHKLLEQTRTRKNAYLSRRLESVSDATDLDAAVRVLEAVLGEVGR